MSDWPVAGDEVVRIPVRRRGSQHRPGREDWMLRFQRPGRAAGRLAVRIPARWKFRSRLLAFGLQMITDSQSRGDFEPTLALYSPRAEVHTVPSTGDAAMLGFDNVYVGPEGVRRFFDQLGEPWESWHWSEVGEVIDFGGGAALALFEVIGTGRRSGAEVGQQVAVLAQLERGLLVRQKNWIGGDAWGEALRATGLEGLDNPGRIGKRSVVQLR